MPYRKWFKPSSQCWTAVPAADATTFHAGSSVGMIQLLKTVGDPQRCQG